MKSWLLICILALLGVIVLFLFLGPYPLKKLDNNSRTLALEAGASSVGIFLIAVREIEGIDKPLIESMEVLVLIIVATVAVFPFFSNPPGNLRYAAIILMLTTGGWWGFYSYRRFSQVKEKERKIIEDDTILDKKERQRFRTITTFFGYVMAFSIWIVLFGSLFT
ncbi:MAG TPA: hypothetical protein VFJ23_08270 [Candidatus Nitrosotalea sp.]|nr:hypothetical protein [Candidatus Nitrosotalea sp.]